MSSSSIGALGRKKIAVLVAALLAFGGFAVVRTQMGAEAATSVVLTMTCDLGGAQSTTYNVSADPASAVPGQPLTLNVASVLAPPSDPTIAGLPLRTIAITTPLPAQVTGGDVMVTGGNLTKASQVNNPDGSSTLNLTANAGVTVGSLQIPSLMFMLTAKPGITGPIVFQGPSKLAIGVDFLGTAINVTCTGDATNPPLVSVPVAAPATTTTVAPTTTTTRPAPTTTSTTTPAPTTTSTTRPAPTTTSTTTPAPTTTSTTRPAPTTTSTTTPAPTTTTTRPAQTTTTTREDHSNPLLRLLLRILCTLFHIGC